MKKISKLLMLMIYPYAYIPFVVIFIAFFDRLIDNSLFLIIVILFAVIINLTALFFAIYNSIASLSNNSDIKDTSLNIMLIKLIHIPAYILHFIIGFIGLLLSVWGIGFVFWAILIDLLTIGLSGIASIGNTIKMYRNGFYSSKSAAFIIGLLHFVYCIDVVVVIYNYIRVKRSIPSQKSDEKKVKLNPR